MKNAFILVLLCLIFSGISAQEDQSENLTSESSSYHVIAEKYGTVEDAILNMTREEWVAYRASGLYDEDLVVQVIENQKNTPEKIALRETQKQTRLLPLENNCGCWVEPDETYTEITTSMWTSSGGSGPDVDSYLGPLALGEDASFDLYGTLFDSLFINSKGLVSFGEGVIDWTPESFPEATHNQIAGFWADIDIREQGAIYYKITDDAIFVNYVEVDYFNSIAANHFSRTNTFQIIITPQGSTYLGDDNVQLCYLDMDWAHGDSGGNGGFNGPSPGINGVDVADETGSHIQLGAFGLNNDNFDGPGGSTDGIQWLDNRSFQFNVAGIDNENPPIPLFEQPCDTTMICLNDTFSLTLPFLSEQILSIEDITIETVGSGTYVDTVLTGNISQFQGGFVGSLDNIGLNHFAITARDNSDTLNSTTGNFYFEVIPFELPELTISGNLYYCGSEETTLFASEGFESYAWDHNDSTTNESTIASLPQTKVQASFMGCVAERSVFIPTHEIHLENLVELPPNPGELQPDCFNDTTLAFVFEQNVDQFESFLWSADLNGLGGNVHGPDSLSFAYISPGGYSLLATDLLGCTAQIGFIYMGTEEFTWDLEVSPEIIDGQLGSATISSSGGTPPFSFDWSVDECSGTSCSGLEAGEYSVTISDESGCFETVNFTIDLNTNINDLENKTLLIYPNPVEDLLYLKLPQTWKEFQIISSNGQLVKKGSLQETVINVSELASGVYTLIVSSGESGLFYRNTFVKK